MIKKIEAIEASVELAMANLNKILSDCRKAKREMEGVSTSSLPKGVDKVADMIVAKRNARLFRKQRTQVR